MFLFLLTLVAVAIDKFFPMTRIATKLPKKALKTHVVVVVVVVVVVIVVVVVVVFIVFVVVVMMLL